MKRIIIESVIGLIMILAVIIYITGCKKADSGSTAASDINYLPQTDKGDTFEGNIILGRPTDTSVDVSITSDSQSRVYLEWGNISGEYSKTSEIKDCSETGPAVFTMDGIPSGHDCYYRLFFAKKETDQYSKTEEYHVNMPKAEGTDFNFVIQSDSHLLNKADTAVYEQNMQNMAGLDPDFMFDLGDTFLNDQSDNALTQSYEKVEETYRQQLSYFDIVTRSSPLFLTIGNHEGEYARYFDGTANSLAAKSTIASTKFYPNPVPNNFYSGNTQKEDLFGSPQNYYAFTWGDALFVSIDPYRYSDVDPYGADGSGDGWAWTLGKTQYDWFKSTLENSNAKYKFVFSHHAIGNFRGGEEIATLYEWGGYDKNGRYLFDQKRPGWGKPIQQIMKDEGVTIFFQGHDHLFAREVVDGVVYQTLPKPAEKIADAQSNFDAYPDADILLNSGFLNINVRNENVQVDYIRNYFVSSDQQEGNTGVVYSYTVDEDKNVNVIKNVNDNIDNYGKNAESQTNDKNTKEKKKSTQKNTTSETDVKMENNSITAVPQSGFSFAIEADPHWDENVTDALYQKTLTNIIIQSPSFLIDLGDTSMAEKLAKTNDEVIKRYELAKKWFSQLGSIPLYLVTGNHDGENGFNTAKNDMAQWARAARLNYFPFPVNTEGFSGNVQTANYYSFTKGDAQFIVLDPYTYSTQQVAKAGGWASTLGKPQYDWLKNTLAFSNSKYKFVFVHNLVGGESKDQRGGAEASQFYEWGGYNESGAYEFDKMRPGWDIPIHDLLVKYGVDIVFHGHDHFYAKQERDGIIYQLVPQPGTSGSSVNDAATYGYETGVFMASAGYIRVVVSGEKAVVEYLKTGDSSALSIPQAYSISP